MRIRELDGQFWGQADEKGGSVRQDGIAGAQGVLFQCPTCAVGKERGEENGRRFIRGAHYIRVPFANPRGARPAPAAAAGKVRWKLVSGTGLDDLTLSPSINCNIPWRDPETGVEHPSSCKFHGYVRNGEAK